ncbi:MAG: hypothetical protein ACR2JC_05985 [Chloroflexota bacterium]
MRPQGPFPVLILHGVHGSAKTTTARVLRALVDPNSAPVRSAPRSDRDLVIAASNAHVLLLDNLSSIAPWLSDGLCRLSTGGGFSTRELFSDTEETIIDVQRPVLLTGIEELATRADLMSRTVIVRLPPIDDGARRPEQHFLEDFEEARPRLLGALLDALCVGLLVLPQTPTEGYPRMADFARWVTATEAGLHLPCGAFLEAYEANRAEANQLTLEASPISAPLRSLLETTTSWEGTATELLAALELHADDTTRASRGWPAAPTSLSRALLRIRPNLRAAGITISDSRSSRTRLYHLQRTRVHTET